ncbi:E3 ubiquitin-protein ligase [Smittium mucronatum]|uniref:E3 ubiquitin-protein ligase n=1 Tax=Smittium mucronatum TaxID=133383 RepID=A0A1R0H1Y3_9FUNG|nr:E3 ubiquitin-protein ligase [Smittium mucronatum]
MENGCFSMYDDQLQDFYDKIDTPTRVSNHSIPNSQLPLNSPDPSPRIKSISIKTRSQTENQSSDSNLDVPLAALIRTKRKYSRNIKTVEINSTKTSNKKTQKTKQLKKNNQTPKSKPIRKSTRSRKPVLETLRDESDFELDPNIETNICFICNKVLNGLNLQEVNTHIDNCLASQALEQSSSTFPDSIGFPNVPDITCTPTNHHDTTFNSGFVEYEWAGQTRVRATALLEGSISSIFNSTSHSPTENSSNATLNSNHIFTPSINNRIQNQAGINDLEIDIEIDPDENNEEVYGESQYSQKDLDKALRSINNESKKALSSKPSNNSKSKPTDNGSKVPTPSALITNDRISSFSNSQLLIIIDSLKAQLADQTELISSSPKCLVCLSNFTTPLTSILCWHVHCESCWLKTLSVKKLCPQCKLITQPGDLRRIYI